MRMNVFDDIIKILGIPYYINEYGVIYNADCVESLKKLKKTYFNQTFTSPPYNIGKEYERVLPLEEYISWSKEWLRQIYNVTENNGSLWLNVGYFSIENVGKAIPISYYLWNLSDFYFQQEIVWNYGAGVSAKKFLSPRNEKILWLIKNKDNYIFNLDDIRDKNVKYPNQKKNGKLRCNTIGKNPSDVWQIAKVTSGYNRSSSEREKHPAQTPRDLVDRIVAAGSNKNDLILDPFMGSGTTFESCVHLNRRFVGFEINKHYCEIAKIRINKFLDKKNYLLL